jgi:hypothetical protein
MGRLGHQVWTPDPTRPAQLAAFYEGDMSPDQAQASRPKATQLAVIRVERRA